MIHRFIAKIKNATTRPSNGSTGQTLVEYAIIIAIISVVTVVVLMSLGKKVKSVTTTINSQLAVAASSH